MIRSHFKVSWRNFLRHKMTSIINVLGLSIGMCVCLSIYLILNFEFSFEDFVPDKNEVYRVTNDKTDPGGKTVKVTNTPFPARHAMQREITGIGQIAGFHLYDSRGEAAKIPGINNKEKKYFSRGEVVVTDSNFFSFFPATVLAGSIALAEPYQVVLTLAKAEKYFGTLAPDLFLGRKIIYGDSLMVIVSGVIKDWPKNTDFGFKDFISERSSKSRFLANRINDSDWKTETEMVFLKLTDNRLYNRVITQLENFGKKYFTDQPGAKSRIGLQPLSAIHFSTENDYEYEFPLEKTHLPALYGLTGIALFILLLAVINFVNLSTAQAMNRVRQIGIRKVMGGTRRDLIFQLLSETFIMAVFSLLISICIINPVLSFFKPYIPDGVHFSLLSPSLYLFLLFVTLLVTFLAGWYPAIKLSSLSPVLSLKGDYFQTGVISKYLRKSLIVFQFAISSCFIICAVIMGSQLRYISGKGPGFSTDAIVTFYPGSFNDTSNKVKTLSDRMKQVTGIKSVALQSFEPTSPIHLDVQLKYKGRVESVITTAIQYGSRDFVSLYEMTIIAGRNFLDTDNGDEFIINQSASQLLGFTKPEDAIGKTLYYGDKAYTVSGVIKDFHENSFREPIRPLVIQSDLSQEKGIAVKFDSKGKNMANIHSILADLEVIWKEYYPEKDFYYRFLDDSIAAMYKKEQDASDLVNASVIITICISCMGLFALSVFTIQQRTKEIGIRKVLGASFLNILTMLNRDFVGLVVIALVIASPIGWYFMNSWLENFVYHIPISWWMFALSGLGAIAIALITVSVMGVKAANANPVESIRN